MALATRESRHENKARTWKYLHTRSKKKIVSSLGQPWVNIIFSFPHSKHINYLLTRNIRTSSLWSSAKSNYDTKYIRPERSGCEASRSLWSDRHGFRRSLLDTLLNHLESYTSHTLVIHELYTCHTHAIHEFTHVIHMPYMSHTHIIHMPYMSHTRVKH